MQSKKKQNRSSVPTSPITMLGAASIIAFGFSSTCPPSNTNITSNLNTSYSNTTILYREEDYKRIQKSVNKETSVNGSVIAVKPPNTFAGISLSSSNVTNKLSGIGTGSLNNLVSDFFKEIDKHSDYLTVESSSAISSFIEFASKMSQIPHEKSAVNFLPNDGIKIVLKLNSRKMIMISKYIVPSDIPLDWAVVSVFLDRKIQTSEVLSLDKIVSKLS